MGFSFIKSKKYNKAVPGCRQLLVRYVEPTRKEERRVENEKTPARPGVEAVRILFFGVPDLASSRCP